MTNPITTSLGTRSRQLADQLVELRSRVREAVAAELGRVVADAVRDLLTATLRGRPPDPERATYRRPGPVRTDPWDDDPDGLEREDDDEYYRYPDDTDERPRHPMTVCNASRPSPSWASALSAGIVATKWLLGRRLRVWPCVGAGVAVSALALAGGPAMRAAFAAVAAALELVCLTQPCPG